MNSGREEPRSVERELTEERFSTGGLPFTQALQRVIAGGSDDEEEQAEDADEMSDEELLAVVEETRAAVKDGRLPLFSDAQALRGDIRRRFNR